MAHLASSRWMNSSTIFGCLLCLATSTATFLSMPYSTDKYYGPDGPWQAVSLGLKYYHTNTSGVSTVNVYPGLLANTISALYVPTIRACDNDTSGTCADGGTIALPPPASNVTTSWYSQNSDSTGWSLYLSGVTWYTEAELPQEVTYTNLLVDVCDVAEVTYPNGNKVAVEVGFAGLGGGNLPIEENLPLGLFSPDITQSNSFGLHIGSAQYDYVGSLIFGGYDRGRVIGPVISYDSDSSLSLLDITIGVEEGASPFSFDAKQSLLKTGDTTQTISAYPRPEYPYISMNQQTIDAITENLPVNFDSSSGYWLWDTSDPLYKKIVGGAAYLGFVLPSLTGSTTNETIKVPFALLNLTLESAVTGLDHDVPYFPVMKSDIPSDYPMFLGRAFLQASFFGTNWGRNISWLAQAPGPGDGGEGLGYGPVDIDARQQNLDVPSGADLFRQSWTNHWTVLSTADGGASTGGDNSEDNTDGDQSNGDDGGLSGGVIGGIVVAVVAGLAIIGAIIWFVLRRRKRNAAAWQQPAPPSYQDDKPGPAPTYAHYGEAQQPVNELPSPEQHGAYKFSPQPQQWHEVEGGGAHAAELSGHAPAELPASHK